MKSRVDEAVKMFEEGYNCCQAVFVTYSDLFGMDRVTALKLGSPMGAGLGRMREVCGTVSAMAMLAGLKEGNTDPDDLKGKALIYERVREMSDKFREHNDTIICRDLLGISEREESAMPQERDASYYENRPCTRLVAEAANIVEEMLLMDEFM